MAIAIVALFILGSAGYHFLKGSITKTFGMLIISLLAAFFAFGYFESLAGLLIGYIAGSTESIIPWAQALSFLLIFALSFSIMQAILVQLTRSEIKFGKNAEYAGRIILGALTGFIISGVCLTFIAMLPLSAKYPYQRFDESNPDAQKPGRVFLNSDGFISGLFGWVSRGSFCAFANPHSFAALHPDYISQLHLNRLGISQNTAVASLDNEIVVPPKNGVYFAPKDLKDAEGNPVEAKSGQFLMVVKAGIKKPSNFSLDRSFVLSQIRLLCGQKKDTEKKIIGHGINIYPAGYLKTSQVMQKARLSEKLSIGRDDLNDKLTQGQGKWVDLVFEVPNNFTPYAIELRQNSIAAVPPPVSAENALPAAVFIPASQCAKDEAEVTAAESSTIYGLVLTGQGKLLDDLSLSIKDQEEWNKLQADSSIEKARFSEELITFVQAELKVTGDEAASTGRAAHPVTGLLKPLEGCNILVLKCNEPKAGSAISGEQLPVLVEINGRTHHPVGIIASAKSGENKIYEVDYCSETSDKNPAGLVVGENGAVAQTFPKKIWITEKAESITAFYCLYLVKPAEDVYITTVKPADAKTGAKLSKFQAFIVR